MRHETLLNVAHGMLGGIVSVLVIFILAITFPNVSHTFADRIGFTIPLREQNGETSYDQKSDSSLTVEDEDIIMREQRIIEVVRTVSPAVVSVTLTKDVPVYKNYYDEESYDPFEEFFGVPSPFGDFFRRRVPVQKEQGSEKVEVGGGTGFLVSADGYVITNRHVVERGDVEYSIISNEGVTYEATVAAVDPVLDIAVLKIDVQNHPNLTFGDSDAIKVGQTAIAIGNALAEFRNTVSVGVISGLSRSITASDGLGKYERLEGVIQTDAAINPGNSGGPLLNLNGEVIGMNVAMAGAENIGFALPSNIIRNVAESVQKTGKIVRPFLGIRYVPITEELKEKNKLPVDYGVLVIRGQDPDELAVMPGSAADKAGIVENDIILDVDGEKLDEDTSLSSVIRSKNVGDTIELNVLHKGEEQTVHATLESYPE